MEKKIGIRRIVKEKRSEMDGENRGDKDYW